MRADPVSIATSTEFRLLLSGFATGVTVVTALDQAGHPHGMTASAVSAVSLEPPLLLVCVDRTADFHTILSAADRFALSVLAVNQENLSRRFAADPMSSRFGGVPYQVGPDGLPLLEGAVAHIACVKWGAYPVGDHTIFIGQVSAGEVYEGKPLLHYRSQYTTTRDP